MRVYPGDEIVLFNGDGWEYIYAIDNITKKEIQLVQKGKSNTVNDSILEVTLYQAVPNKFEKIEYIIQKWVEIGISRFVFFRSDRVQKLVISKTKEDRFRAIAQEALEQCGGNKMPDIEFMENIDFDNVTGEKIVLHTSIEWWVSLRNVANSLFIPGKNIPEISLFIWPEWGFSQEEIDFAIEKWAFIVNFWSRIFRTETVSSVVVFYLQQLI